MQPQKKVKITKTLWECDPRKLKQKTHGSYENVIDLLGHNSLTGWDSITSFSDTFIDQDKAKPKNSCPW